MPLFALSKQGFNPHAALAHRFLIWFGCMIGTDLLEVLLIKTAFEQASLITGGALSLERTGVTGRRVALIAFLPFIVGMGVQGQDSIVGTNVNIPLRIVAKRLLAVEGSSLVKIGQWNIGSHVLVFHHFRWGDQRSQDDTRLAPIHNVVRVVAQMASLPFGGHERRIWICRADDKVCHAAITPTGHLPLWASLLLNPVMPLLVCPGQVLSHAVFQTDRKWDGSRPSGFTERGR